MNPVRFHLIMVFVWAALAIPTVLWWKDSVFWVALMSLYANLVGHWSSYQAAHAESKVLKKMDEPPDPPAKVSV